MIGSLGALNAVQYSEKTVDRSASLGIGRLGVMDEFRVHHTVTWAANKPSEVNAFNSPLTPALIVWNARGQQHSKQTLKTLSKPILLPANFGG